MESSTFLRVDDVAKELGVSTSYAYKLIRKLNGELNNMGYLTVPGRISKKFFMEKMCYEEQDNTKRRV
jgi:transposase